MKANVKKWIALGSGLLLPLVAWAQTPPVADGGWAMIQAPEALRQIFGVDTGSLFLLAGPGLPTILATVSTVLNTAALTATVAIILLTFFTGTMQQAHEGAVLGRRFSTLWVPLRSVLSLFYLVPLPSGYSVLQILILWVAMFGSNLADKAWMLSTDFMQTNTGVAALPMLPGTRDLVSNMYASAVCARKLTKTAADGQADYAVAATAVNAGLYQSAPDLTLDWSALASPLGTLAYRIVAAPLAVKSGVSYDASGAGVNGSGINTTALCGHYEIDRKLLLGADAPTAATQQSNLQQLASDLDSVASMQVDDHASMGNIRNRLIVAEAYYSTRERDRAVQFVADSQNEVATQRVQQELFSRTAGWTSVGAWYMTFTSLSDLIRQQIAITPNSQGPRTEQMSAAMLEDLGPDMNRAKVLVDPGLLSPTTQMSTGLPSKMVGLASESLSTRGAPSTHSEFAADDSMLGHMVKAMKAFQDIFESSANPASLLIDAMGSTAGGDPVIALSDIGHSIIGSAEAAVGVSVAAAIADTAVFEAAAAVSAPFFIGGGALAYYIPLVPYIFWMLGVASWLLMLIEAVALAPLWAAAHALPDGEGWSGQHARQGYILVLSLIARPILMLVGFFAGMLLVRYLSLLVGVTFKQAMLATQGSHIMGVASTIGYFIILLGIYLAIVRFSFGLIHTIPDRGLRFIGGGDSLGDGGEAHAHRGAAYVAGAATGMLGRLKVPRLSKSNPKPGFSE